MIESKTLADRRKAISDALADVQDSATVARDKRSNPVALIIPTTHPEFARVLKLLNGSIPEQVSNTESVRQFLNAEYFRLSAKLPSEYSIPVDAIHGHYQRWASDNGIQKLRRPTFRASIRNLSIMISRDHVFGLVQKHIALSEDLIEAMQ